MRRSGSTIHPPLADDEYRNGGPEGPRVDQPLWEVELRVPDDQEREHAEHDEVEDQSAHAGMLGRAVDPRELSGAAVK